MTEPAHARGEPDEADERLSARLARAFDAFVERYSPDRLYPVE